MRADGSDGRTTAYKALSVVVVTSQALADPITLNGLLRHVGYDGIQHVGGLSRSRGARKPHDVYIAFDPVQVKSTLNLGTFDASNPKISFQEGGGQNVDGLDGESIGMLYPESMARVQSAGWNETLPVIAKLKTELGLGALTDKQFWKVFARGEPPKAILDEMEARFTGASTAKIGGDLMTESMNQRARYQAFAGALSLANHARKRAANQVELADRDAVAMVALSERYNRIDPKLRDAEQMGAHLNDLLRDSIKEAARDLDRGPDAAFAAGNLIGAIRELERLTPDQPIPAEYQRVFKEALDRSGTPLFNELSALAKLDLPLGKMSVTEVVQAIRDNAAADPALASLTKNRPLMLALASLAQNNAREMDMMQLRLMRDTATYTAIKAQLDEIRTASDARLDEISKTIKSSQQNQTLSDRLSYQFLDVRRKFRAKQRSIARAEESAAINTRVASAMQKKAKDLSRQVGAFSNWEPINGAVYMAMRLSDDGTWKAIDRKLQMIGPVVSQEAQIKSDLVANRNWLDIHSDQAGSRLYQEISKQTKELTHLDVGRQLEAVHRGWMDNLLMPLGKKFASTGKTAGKRIQQMLNRYGAIAKSNADGVEAKARTWTKALQNATEAAGFSNYRDFFQTVYDGVIYAVESEPGLGEAAVLRVAARAARRRIPEGFPVAADFDNKLAVLLRATKEINELLLGIAEENGVFIEDSRVNDPLTGKGTLLRHAIKYGWLTNTRKLRAGIIQTLVRDMEAAGWKARVKESPGVAARDSMFAEIEPEEVPALIEKYFTPDIIREFVEPFVHKPGKEVFFGAPDQNGKARFVSQLEIQNLWQESGGDVLAFIDATFDFSNVLDNRDALPEYRKAMLQRFDFLFNMESKLAAETGVVNSPADPDGQKAHRIMDSRTNDLLPPEHFEYEVYDPANSRKMLEEIAYHAAFGRNGEGLKGAGADLRNDLQSDARAYGLLNGSRKEKMKKAAQKNQDFRSLERAADTLARVDPWLEQIGKYFNTKNQAGAVGDARALLSLVGLNVAAFLNSVKAGLNNVVSLGDFPVVFGGISKTSLNAVRLAVGNLGKGVFGTALESVGVNVIRAGEYAKEIGEFNESRKTARLPFGEFIADIGMVGRFQEGKTDRVIQGTRYLQQLFRKGMKFGSGKDFGPFHLLWAPFRFFNEQSASAIATANVQTFEMIVKRAMDYYAANPEDAANPVHRFTAADLKMDGTWFSDESAFKFFRDRAVDQKIGNIEDIARDAAKRVAVGDRILTRDQVIGIAMVALDEISMESSINSRASELSTNTVLKYGGVLLGWPLSKMNQVNQSLKTPEGQLTAKSFLKGIGIMAAWSLPVGLAYSLMIDDYDEEFLGKKSNLLGVGTDKTAVDNSLAVLQRTAKVGAYGLGGDFASSLINWVDPKSGQRDFDLNSRVVIYSQFANARDMVRNFVLQDFTYTYESVGRGLVYAMGGGGLLQYQQMLNKALGLNNSESATTNRINVASYIRAAAPEVGLELKAGGARSSPTPMSVWLREMQVTALANDRMGFLNAYRNAIEVARKGGDIDAENTVRQGFQGRTPLSVLGRQPSEAEFAKLMQAMDETGRETLRTAMRLHETFAAMITPDPTERKSQLAERRDMGMTRPDSFMAARRKAAASGMGY